MPTRNIPLGLGFEARLSDREQRGLTDARNADLTGAGVIRKRSGSDAVSMATTDGGTLPSTTHAVWHRDEEECAVGGDGQLYSFDECANAWDPRGSWRGGTLREWAIEAQVASAVASVAGQTVAGCSVALWEEFDIGSLIFWAVSAQDQAVIVPRTLVNNPGERPKVAATESFALLAYVTGTTLRIAAWDPEDPTSLSWQDVTTTLFAGAFDVKRTPGQDDIMVAYATSSTDVTVARYDATTSVVASQAVVLVTAIADDLAIGPRTDSIFHLCWIAAGNIVVTREVGGTNTENSIAIGPNVPVRVSVVAAPTVSEGPDQAIVAIEEDAGAPQLQIVRVLRVAVFFGGFDPVRVQRGAFLQAHLAAWGNTFLLPMATSTSRSYMVEDALSGEILSRAYYGRGEGAAVLDFRQAISAPDTANVEGARVWVSLVPGDNQDRVIAYAEYAPDDGPEAPAVLDNVAHAAHSGYIRAYDGRYPFEHDWHELPAIISTAQDALGSLTLLGTYTYALTWEWQAKNGTVYRSGPTIATTTLTGGNNRIVLTVKSLNFTERTDVKLVVWRSQDALQGDPNLYRGQTIAAPSSSSTLTITMSASDAGIVVGEVLDQVTGGVLANDPTPATDFCALAGGRLWTGDPERAFLARYSLPRREGFGIGWSPLQGQELPEQDRVTAMADQDGQFIAFTANGAAIWFGDGPDATGAGAFSTPQTVPIEVGATSQETIAATPAGIVYGSPSGPRLFTRGRQSQDISEVLERLFLDEGQNVVTCFYQPATAELHVLDDGDLDAQPRRGSLRLHMSSGRWAQDDASRQVRDASISPSGSIIWLLRDGSAILRANRAVYQDAGADYEVTIGTPWVRSSEAGLQASCMPLSATIHGNNRDTHTLKLSVYTDYRENLVETALFDVAAALASAAHGRYQFRHSFRATATRRVGAIRVAAILGGSTSAASLEMIEVEIDAQDSRTPIELDKTAYPTSVT